MRVVVALGGNALARRGEPMTAELLRDNVIATVKTLANLARDHELVISHGNGPQVGLLALQNLAYDKVPPYPLDILGAQTQGMIGYLLQEELTNELAGERDVQVLLTSTVVDPADPAFETPTKFVGPMYTLEEARAKATEFAWQIAQDGAGYRRVVPSPEPIHVVQTPAVEILLGAGAIVVCAGGGGVPVRADGSAHHGVQAVVDKDLTSAVLAQEIGADLLVILTDGDYVVEGWGTPAARNIRTASAAAIGEISFAAGSMAPKVQAGINFARAGGRTLIGPLERAEDVFGRRVGTEIRADFAPGIEYAD